MQVGDWLQRWWGKNGVSSPESLFHMNFYASYFVLNMHYVPPWHIKSDMTAVWSIQHEYTHQSLCAQIYTCAYSRRHTRTHTSMLSFSFFPALCSHLLMHPTFPQSFLWIQKCSHIPQTQKQGGGYSLQIWVRITSVWISTSASGIIHQPSEEQLLHQRALKDAEYLKLYLFKTQLHFRSDLPWQCHLVWKEEEESAALCCAVWGTHKWEVNTKNQ